MVQKQKTLDGKTVDVPTKRTHSIVIYPIRKEGKAGYISVVTELSTEELTALIREKLGLICQEPKAS
jgi:hypothetical protein